MNSTPDNIGRNAGIFYVMFQSSGLIGNTFSYFQFKESYEISDETRFVFVSALLVISAMATCTLLFVLPMPWAQASATAGRKADTPWTGMVRSVKLMGNRDMILLTSFFIYTGLVFTFWSGVYGPSLTFSRSFDADGNSLTGLHGIMVHTGEILAGLFFAFFNDIPKRIGRYPFVIIGTTLHFVAFIIIYLNVPNDAPLGVTSDDASLVVPSSTGLALFSSFIIGMGVVSLESQTVSLIGSIHADRASQAFAIVKVCQHGAIGIGFAYSGYIGLYWQLGILIVFGLLGAIAYTIVDRKTRRRIKESKEEEARRQKYVQEESWEDSISTTDSSNSNSSYSIRNSAASDMKIEPPPT